MIARIQGKVLESTLVSAVIDVQGVGYEVLVPLTTAEKVPPIGQSVSLFTLAVYREDAQLLFGFATREDREFFRLLVEKVSGIGPKTALSILSKLSVAVLQTAIAVGDIKLLSKCPGIGKKTAERLVIELRDKVAPVAQSTAPSIGDTSGAVPIEATPFHDAVAALIALGFKPVDADKAIRKAMGKLGEDASAEKLIRASLGS